MNSISSYDKILGLFLCMIKVVCRTKKKKGMSHE